MFNRLLARRGAAKPVVALALLLPVVAGGVLAFNLFFNRPGESAIRLIPESAMMVVTLDTTPSAEQVPTFTRILNAVKREGLEAELDKALTSALDKSPLAAELRPELSRSFALAMLSKEDTVVLLAVKDPKKAVGILAKHTTKSTEAGLEVYKSDKTPGAAALIGPYLVFAKNAASLAQVESVRQGKTAPLEKNADYQQARASLPKDANLMVFVSPQALKELAKESKQVNLQAMEATRYLTFGMTVRENGLELVGQVPTALAPDSPLRGLGQVVALDPGVLKKLPPGALGVFAFSQPGKLWEPVTGAALTADQREEMQSDLAKMESDLGLSVQKDLVPALGGNLVVAVYPDAVQPTRSVDLVAFVDDANGSDPAAVANRLRAFLAKHEVQLQEQERGDLKMITAAKPISGKSVCYTQSGNAVLFASTPDLLESAFRTYSQAESASDSSLLSTPSFSGMQSEVVPGAQTMLMVDVRRVLETLQPEIEKSMGGDRDLKFEDLLGLFGSPNSGLVASGKYDGQSGQFQLHVPLDYDRLIHLVGVGARKAGSGGQPPVPSFEGAPSVVQ